MLKKNSPLHPAEKSKRFPIPLFQALIKTRSQGEAGKGKREAGAGRLVARVEGRVGARIPRERRGMQVGGEKNVQGAGDSFHLLLQSVPFSSWQLPMLQRRS